MTKRSLRASCALGVVALLSVPAPAQAQVVEAVIGQALGLPTPAEVVAESARGWGYLLSQLEQLPNRPGEHEAMANRAKARAEILYEQARRAADSCDQAGLTAATTALDTLVQQVEARQGRLFSLFPYLPRALLVVQEYQRKARTERLRNCPKPGASAPPATVGVIPGATTTPNETVSIDTMQFTVPAFGGWGDYMDAAAKCDRAGMAKALARMEAARKAAAAEYARVFNLPSPFPRDVMSLRDAVEQIDDWIRSAKATPVKGCPEPVKDDTIGRIGSGLTVVGDSDTWCEFGTTDPRDLPVPGGDDPRDGPGKDGDDPRDGPGLSGDDPRDGPSKDGDDPRDGPGKPAISTGGGISITGKPGDDPRDEPTGDDPRDKPTDDDPRDQPTVPFVVKATKGAITGIGAQQTVVQQQIKLFAQSQQLANIQLPLTGAPKPQTDASSDPLMCTTGTNGECKVDVPACQVGPCKDGKLIGAIPASGFTIEVASMQTKSYNILVPTGTAITGELAKYVIGRQPATAAKEWVTVLATGAAGDNLKFMIGKLGNQALKVEENICRTKEQSAPNDPYFRGKGAWRQEHDDQWAIKRVGLTPEAGSAWTKLGPNPQPVIVAVIDSGLDWNHADFDWRNIWKNPREVPDNGIDDDRNGYVDDVIGWDFLGLNNKPWDHDGHGTLTTSIIAATTNNGVGMAGINPNARIMVLKALNAFGRSRASFVAEAIRYAADNGARIVNLSVGGPGLTGIETDAIAYARGKGVLIVVAAGNDGVNVKDQGLASNEQVMTVGATGLKDEHLTFSNWGPQVDIAAPGQDVLGLRARRTDTVLGIPDVPYTAGQAYVGTDRRYYRVSGTSFAAPIVAGIASLVLSKRPDLTVDQLEQVLLQSAQDIQTPGRDNFSGVGLVDARAALDFEPGFRLDAGIAGVEVVQGPAGPVVRVMGTVAADRFGSARLEIGAGREATQFKTIAADLKPGTGPLADLAAANFVGAPLWTIRLVVKHANGTEREARFVLDVGG